MAQSTTFSTSTPVITALRLSPSLEDNIFLNSRFSTKSKDFENCRSTSS